MDVDEDDDFYATEDGAKDSSDHQPHAPQPDVNPEQDDQGLEEGEEDEGGEDGSDSVCFGFEWLQDYR
jgi:hypothetical protein